VPRADRLRHRLRFDFSLSRFLTRLFSRSTLARMLQRSLRGLSQPLLRPQPSRQAPSVISRSLLQQSPILRFASSTARPATKKAGRRWKGLAAVGLVGTGVFLYDRYEGAEALRRSFRTWIFGITLAIDFKMNFSPDNPDGIDALHERTAKRLHKLCVENNGMYIKLAQSVSSDFHFRIHI